MKYVFAYTAVFVGMFCLGLYDRQPALTDALLLGGSHACGLMFTCACWLSAKTAEMQRRTSRLTDK